MYIIHRYSYDSGMKKYKNVSQSLQVKVRLCSGVVWPLTYCKFMELRMTTNAMLNSSVLCVCLTL